MTKVPKTWAFPDNDPTFNGNLTNFSFDSAFWVFNLVANFAYNRWFDIYPEVASKIVEIESGLFSNTA